MWMSSMYTKCCWRSMGFILKSYGEVHMYNLHASVRCALPGSAGPAPWFPWFQRCRRRRSCQENYCCLLWDEAGSISRTSSPGPQCSTRLKKNRTRQTSFTGQTSEAQVNLTLLLCFYMDIIFLWDRITMHVIKLKRPTPHRTLF